MLEISDGAADQAYVWLTTIGRRTGRRRTVELWFGLEESTLYFLAGGGKSAGWVQNGLAAADGVRVRLAGHTYRGFARAVEPGTDEDDAARRRLAAKYQGWSEGHALSAWARTSFCMALDLAGRATGNVEADRPSYR
jgi:deazaflavin-dependent oxidoreductase (nitroreductase family)